MQWMTLAKVQVKWLVISIDRLAPDIFSKLGMKGHVLHRAATHLKVPGWLLVWNALLTKTLPIRLSRLNGINGGCERYKYYQCRDHFEVIWSKFFSIVDFTACLRGWNVRVNGIISLFSFWGVCNADCWSICWARWWPAWTTREGYLGLSNKSQVSSDFKEKSESPLERRQSLRNWE